MQVPQLLGDVREWANRIVAALTNDLPADIAQAAVPAGGIVLYEGEQAPEGWLETTLTLAPPTGYIWIQRPGT